MDNVVEGEILTPMPKKKQGEAITMNFIDAMQAIIAGKSVRRLSWPTQTDHCLMKDGWLTIHTKGAFHTWSISEADIVDAQDWVIINEAN